MEEINALLEKYDNFKYEQIRSVQHLADGSKVVTLVVLDDEGEDLHTIKIEFSNVKDSKILVDSVLSYMDMTSGITIIKENDLYGFAIGSGTAMLHVHNAPLFIIASDIKILEDK
jgi:hypothetical protein